MPSILRIGNNATTYFLRISKKVKWSIKKVAPRKSSPISRMHYEEHRKRALSFAKERVIHWNQFYGFDYQKISVKNQKTRWGSCSKKGNLSFNYKIALLPVTFADYIVVHELCHLKEFNHSQNFWNLVVQTTPQYKEIRRKLKQMPLRSMI